MALSAATLNQLRTAFPASLGKKLGPSEDASPHWLRRGQPRCVSAPSLPIGHDPRSLQITYANFRTTFYLLGTLRRTSFALSGTRMCGFICTVFSSNTPMSVFPCRSHKVGRHRKHHVIWLPISSRFSHYLNRHIIYLDGILARASSWATTSTTAPPSAGGLVAGAGFVVWKEPAPETWDGLADRK